MMSVQEFRDMLQDILEREKRDYDDEQGIVHLKKIDPFEFDGPQTKDVGLFVNMSDGSDFQVRIEKVVVMRSNINVVFS